MRSVVCPCSGQSAGQAPVSALAVCEQVVMERPDAATLSSAYRRGISMTCPCSVVGVVGTVEGFADHCLLQRDALRPARRESLVRRPCYRAVVHDGVVAARNAEAVEAAALFRLRSGISAVDAHEARDAVRVHAERRTLQDDTFPGGCLSGDGDVFVRAEQSALKFDISRHVEDDSPRTLHLRYAVSERAGLRVIHIVVERCDVIHRAPAPADGEASVTLRSGEGEMSRAERPHVAFVSGAVCRLFVDAPVVDVMVAEIVHGVCRRGGDGYLREVCRVGAEHDMVSYGIRGTLAFECRTAVVAVGVIVEVCRNGVHSLCAGVGAVEDEGVDGY